MKKNTFLFFIIITIIACFYIIFPMPKVKEETNIQTEFSAISKQDTKQKVTETSSETKPISDNVDNNNKITKADKIIAYAKTKLKLPYKQAGTTDSGYDCSGLIMMSFKQEKFLLPRISYQMAERGKPVKKDEARKGDLIFFATNPNKPKKINHVGLVTEVKEGVIYFIHSSTKRGVIINNTSEKYYQSAFIKLKRILKDA